MGASGLEEYPQRQEYNCYIINSFDGIEDGILWERKKYVSLWAKRDLEGWTLSVSILSNNLGNLFSLSISFCVPMKMMQDKSTCWDESKSPFK